MENHTKTELKFMKRFVAIWGLIKIRNTHWSAPFTLYSIHWKHMVAISSVPWILCLLLQCSSHNLAFFFFILPFTCQFIPSF